MLSISHLQVPRLIRWFGSLAVLLLALMTLLRLGTHVAFAREGSSLAQSWPAFWLGLRFDARVVAAILLPLLVLGGIKPFNPFLSARARRGWVALLAIVTGLLLLVYAIDFLHFRYLGQRLNATVLGFVEDARISAAMVWQSYPVVRVTLAVVLGTLAMVAAIRRLHGRAATAHEPARRGVRAGWYGAALLVSAVAMFGRLSQYPLRWSDAFNLRHEASAQLSLNPIESFLSSLNFRGTGFDRAKVAEHYPRVSAYLGVAAPDAERLNFERHVPARASAGPRPNVVLVLCESFSGYKSSMWGNPLDTTPFFAGLTREGVFFDNCFTPHFGTARGVWATITGTPDVSPVETASRNPSMVDQHTIIADFEGYRKLYFLGGSSSWANIRGLLTNNIRDLQLYEEGAYASPRIDVWGISDKNLFLEANQVLRQQTQPFFAIIQTADNHRPYTIPDEDLKEFTKVDLPEATVRQHGFDSLAELNAFRYTDFSFRKFFEVARQAPYFDNTLFVFVGDHGIGGDAGAMFPRAWTDQHLTRYHVPLLFYAPKLLPPRRIHSVSSMVDILPTIAGLAGISYRNRTLGRDLLRQEEIDRGVSNVAFIIDHNDKTVGAIRGPHYAFRRAAGRPEFVWADFAAPAVPPDARTAAELPVIAEAWHETARYLLLNNAKPVHVPATGVVGATRP